MRIGLMDGGSAIAMHRALATVGALVTGRANGLILTHGQALL